MTNELVNVGRPRWARPECAMCREEPGPPRRSLFRGGQRPEVGWDLARLGQGTRVLQYRRKRDCNLTPQMARGVHVAAGAVMKVQWIVTLFFFLSPLASLGSLGGAVLQGDGRFPFATRHKSRSSSAGRVGVLTVAAGPLLAFWYLVATSVHVKAMSAERGEKISLYRGAFQRGLEARHLQSTCIHRWAPR